jgi:hypothetical protein
VISISGLGGAAGFAGAACFLFFAKLGAEETDTSNTKTAISTAVLTIRFGRELNIIAYSKLT